MATHSSFHAWEILWTEELGRLQSMGSQKDKTEYTRREKNKPRGISQRWRVGLCWQATQGVLPSSFWVRCLAGGPDCSVRPRMEALHVCLISVNCGAAKRIRDQCVTEQHTGSNQTHLPTACASAPQCSWHQEPGSGTTCPPHQGLCHRKWLCVHKKYLSRTLNMCFSQVW